MAQVELSKDEMALICEALLHRGSFLKSLNSEGSVILHIAEKANAYVKLHVKLLHVRANDMPAAPRTPVPGDKVHGTRTVHWVSHETKRYATGDWQPEKPNYTASWKEVVLR